MENALSIVRTLCVIMMLSSIVLHFARRAYPYHCNALIGASYFALTIYGVISGGTIGIVSIVFGVTLLIVWTLSPR